MVWLSLGEKKTFILDFTSSLALHVNCVLQNPSTVAKDNELDFRDAQQRLMSCLVIRETNVLFVKTLTLRMIAGVMNPAGHITCRLIVSIPGHGSSLQCVNWKLCVLSVLTSEWGCNEDSQEERARGDERAVFTGIACFISDQCAFLSVIDDLWHLFIELWILTWLWLRQINF